MQLIRVFFIILELVRNVFIKQNRSTGIKKMIERLDYTHLGWITYPYTQVHRKLFLKEIP